MKQSKSKAAVAPPVEIRLRFPVSVDEDVRLVQEELNALVPTSRPKAYAALVMRGLEAWKRNRSGGAQ